MGKRRVKYETNNGSIFYVECDSNDSIDDVIGTQPSGSPTEEMTVKIQKNNKKFGISPRYALFVRTVGEDEYSETGYMYQGGRQYKEVPCLTTDAFDDVVTGKPTDTGVTKITHRGEEYHAVRKVPEDIN